MTELRYCMTCHRERSADGNWKKFGTHWRCPVCISRIRNPTLPGKNTTKYQKKR